MAKKVKRSVNRFLFIVETLLLVGVIEEFIESYVMRMDQSVYMTVLMLMLLIGVLFYFALGLIQGIAGGAILFIVSINKSRALRLIVHACIFACLFYLYLIVYF
jgi:hypothetical protein